MCQTRDSADSLLALLLRSKSSWPMGSTRSNSLAPAGLVTSSLASVVLGNRHWVSCGSSISWRLPCWRGHREVWWVPTLDEFNLLPSHQGPAPWAKAFAPTPDKTIHHLYVSERPPWIRTEHQRCQLSPAWFLTHKMKDGGCLKPLCLGVSLLNNR